MQDEHDGAGSSLTFEAPLDEEYRKALAQYAYQLDRRIRDVSFRDGRLVLRTRDGAPLGDEVRQSLQLWAGKLVAESPDLGGRVLRERTASALAAGAPLAELRRSGLMMEEGMGLVGLRGGALSFRDALDAHLRKQALAAGAIEHEYPPVLGLDALVQSGYVGNFPQHVLFLSEMDREGASVARVQGATAADAADPSRLDRALSTSTLVLSPTICYHCFRVHRGHSLPDGGRLFTAVGKCGRKEPFVGPADRLQLFTMREVIAFGTAREVEAERQRWMELAWKLVTRLDLTARLVTAVDPFFGFTNKKKVYQSLAKAKYELQVRLPEEERWCAVASFNHHGASLTRAFQITSASPSPLQSGCVGFGYERFIVAAVAQRGLAFDELVAALSPGSSESGG